MRQASGALWFVAGLLAVAPVVDASWWQAGHDAARTGATPDAGPAFEDVAFRVDLPGGRALLADPILVDGAVYVLTTDEHTLTRVDLSSGNVTVLRAFEQAPQSFAADATAIYVVLEETVEAVPYDGGAALWSAPIASRLRDRFATLCDSPGLDAGTLYFTCWQRGRVSELFTDAEDNAVFACALDVATGAERWCWDKDVTSEAQGIGTPAAPDAARGLVSLRASSTFGLTVLGPYVLVLTQEAAGITATSQYNVWGLDAADGRLLWARNTSLPTDPNAFQLDPRQLLAWATGTPTVAYTKLDELVALNPATGGTIWSADVRDEDSAPVDYGGGLALAGDTLYVTSRTTLRSFNTLDRSMLWRSGLDPSWTWGQPGLTIANGSLYGRTLLDDTDGAARTNALVSVDATNGSVRWRRELTSEIEPPGAAFFFAIGEGVAAAAGVDGTLTVIGASPAGLQVAPAASTPAPAPGEPVTLDLSGSRAGPASGDPVQFRVDWGDGTVEEWSSDPVRRHTYAARGPVTLRAQAADDRGNTASTLVTLDVGGTVPTSPGFFERLLPLWWIPVALVAAGAGVAALGRRRAPPPAAALAATRPAPGVLFLGQYAIVRSLGEGSHGQAWLARQEKLRRDVVIKQLRADVGMAHAARERFHREARILAALDHPNVTRIHDIEEVGEEWFLVMEYVDGGSLDAHRERGVVPLVRAGEILDGMLAGLAYIHERGVVHRDIKPSNVILTSGGVPKIADFGVAREVAGSQRTMGATMGPSPGTPLYMAPEQLDGIADVRSDLYAAGIVFHGLVSDDYYLQPSPRSETELRRALASRAPTLEFPALPAPLAAWLNRALAPDPAHRFPTAEAMRAALREAMRGP